MDENVVAALAASAGSFDSELSDRGGDYVFHDHADATRFANEVDDLVPGVEAVTGLYDVDDDERDGSADEFTGCWYVSVF